MNRQGRNIWSCVKKVCNAERIRKKGWRPIDGRVIHRVLRILFHGRLAPYKSAKINAGPFIECCAEPFIALRAIHEGLSPNKSKIKNSWKCINALRLFFILSLLGLQLNQSIYPVIL